MTKRTLFLVFFLGCLAMVGVVLAGLWYTGHLGNEGRRYVLAVQRDKKLASVYKTIQENQEKLAHDPENQSLYLILGIKWKTLAEQSTDKAAKKYFFTQSLAIYERAVELFEGKNALLYLNSGVIATSLEDYGRAEKHYMDAIKYFPSDAEAYINLTNLYIFYIPSEPKKILGVFDAGIKSMVDYSRLLQGRAEYFKRIKKYEAALNDYKILLMAMPKNTGYQQSVQDLEDLLKQK